LAQIRAEAVVTMDDMRTLFPNRRDALLGLAAAVALLLLLSRVVHVGTSQATATEPVRPAPALKRSERVVVDVVGAVRRPGVYRLPDGARVADAVARAGGATRAASLEAINLAAPIGDGQQVVVPRRGRVGSSTAGGAVPQGPLQLSTATAEQLDALPGVGPVTARKILDYLSQHGAVRSVEELDAIPGIGPARLEQLRGLVVP
jgi:competence protein ComEA